MSFSHLDKVFKRPVRFHPQENDTLHLHMFCHEFFFHCPFHILQFPLLSTRHLPIHLQLHIILMSIVRTCGMPLIQPKQLQENLITKVHYVR